MPVFENNILFTLSIYTEFYGVACAIAGYWITVAIFVFVSILLTSLVLHRLNVWWRTRDASSVASGPNGPSLGQGSVQSSAQNSRTTLH